MKYIIEHLEEELYEWCILEYTHISEIVGKDNLLFTNVKQDKEKLHDLGSIEEKSVAELNLNNACLLDPQAEQTLSPDDQFEVLIFGGILGDYPPKKRTANLLSSRMNIPMRNLGNKQMSTNTAVLVAKKIVEGTPFDTITFQDEIEIITGEDESVELPYRYVLENGKPILPKGLIELLKKEGTK